MGHRRYEPADIDRGLLAIITTGSDSRASELTGIKRETLRDWRTTHHDRLLALRDEHEARVAKIVAGQAEEIALMAGHVERTLLERFDTATIDALKPAEIAATLRNISTSKALQIDKASSPLRERPSHVQHNTGIDELMTRMAKAMGFTDSTATEIQDEERRTLPPVSASVNAQG